MKKYVAPEMVCLRVDIQGMICLSGGGYAPSRQPSGGSITPMGIAQGNW